MADSELIGKTLTDGKITFRVSKTFYHDENVSEKELETILEEADNINLIGKNCIDVAMKKGIVSKKGIILISDIPHAQVYKLNPGREY